MLHETQFGGLTSAMPFKELRVLVYWSMCEQSAGMLQ